MALPNGPAGDTASGGAMPAGLGDLDQGPPCETRPVTLTAVQTTSTPRAGRRFLPVGESELIPDALAACERLPGSERGMVVVREMTGPIGIPDLTALVGPRRALDARLAHPAPPILNRIDASIVASTHLGALRSSAAISRALGWPLDLIERRLPELVLSGALLEPRPRRYLRAGPIRPLGRIFAVEAKVKDASAAIAQIRAYGSWADGCVLVMGRVGENSLGRLLAAVDEDRSGLVVAGRPVRRPRIIQHDFSRRLWAAEHFVAALRGRHQPSVAP